MIVVIVMMVFIIMHGVNDYFDGYSDDVDDVGIAVEMDGRLKNKMMNIEIFAQW